MPRLTALIIAKDEERDLPACLESVKGLADEIVIVIDETTADGTEDIARAAGAKIQRRAFDGFAGQKSAALALATGDWVLSIDCDERLTPELREEIRRVIADGGAEFAAYELPFRFIFLGRRLRFGGVGGETHLRLLRRESARVTGGLVHEGFQTDGRVGVLRGAVEHESYADLDEYLRKMEWYTALGAKKAYERGDRFHFWHHLVPAWEFFSRAVLRLGFLDGHAGLAWAGLCAAHAWVKRLKLRELERGAVS